jgi:N,N'-diacetyllegionaminate synthase
MVCAPGPAGKEDAMQIGKYRIGSGSPCFIVAEAGVNHNGDINLAHRLIDVAVEAGADAVKFQTFKPELVISPAAPKAAYQIALTDAQETQLDMVRKLQLSYRQFEQLKARCEERNILFLSTPFDHDSVDFLADVLDVAALKVPSGEVTNLPFLERVASKHRPVILSTGMSNLGEVDVAARTLQSGGCRGLGILHCVTNYPTSPADVNLRAMETMRQAFNVPIGFSDHTLGIDVALAAVAMGAAIIEKHYTLDKSLPGPDHRASLEPRELAAMVSGIRTVESALGDGRKVPRASEVEVAQVARRSLFARRDLKSGESLSLEDVVALRPAGGISPAHWDLLKGRPMRRDVRAGTMISWQDL